MKKNSNLVIAILMSAIMSLMACDSNRNKATLGGSLDTGNTREGQGGSEFDRKAIENAKQDTTQKMKDSLNISSKGNANPTGHTAPANQ